MPLYTLNGWIYSLKINMFGVRKQKEPFMKENVYIRNHMVMRRQDSQDGLLDFYYMEICAEVEILF